MIGVAFGLTRPAAIGTASFETSSALEQVDESSNNGNHEQEMNQTAADVADEAKKPKNDEDDYYGPEHGYIFPLSLFKRRITTESGETIKQKVTHQGADAPRLG